MAGTSPTTMVSKLRRRAYSLDGGPCQRFPVYLDRGPTRLRRHDDFRKTQPARQRLKLLGDRVHGVRRRVRLEVHRMDEQPSRLTVGLQVEPGHEQVAEQEGKDVIAVLALVRRRVNLDPVVEVEEPQRAGSLPDERIERRQQRPRRDATRPAGVTMKIGEPRPARNLDRLENARLDERLDCKPCIVRAKTKIVAQVLRPWRRRAPERRGRRARAAHPSRPESAGRGSRPE